MLASTFNTGKCFSQYETLAKPVLQHTANRATKAAGTASTKKSELLSTKKPSEQQQQQRQHQQQQQQQQQKRPDLHKTPKDAASTFAQKASHEHDESKKAKSKFIRMWQHIISHSIAPAGPQCGAMRR